MPSVFVTGAGGFVATHARKYLNECDFRIISASRRTIKPLKNESTIRINQYNDDSISEQVAGFDAALHLVGSGRQTVQTTYAHANFETTLHVIRQCQNSNIRHITYLSGLGVSSESPLGYFISKYVAEQAIINSGVDYTILRPSYIIGPNDHLTRNLQKQVQNGKLYIPGSGKYLLQPISIQDTVRILEKAATGQLRNQILDMVGPRAISFMEYAKVFAGPNIPISHIDMEAAYRQAILGQDPIYELDDLNIMVAGFVGDHSKLSRATGMKFRDVLEACGHP